MRKVLLSLALLALTGCASTSLMNGIMSSWEGANIDDVAQQWGYPDEQREFNGRTLYVWHHNKSAPVPMVSSTTGSVSGTGAYRTLNATTVTSGGGMMHGSCDRILEVEPGGTVVRWQWGGNNCPFLEAMEYRSWRRR